MTEKRREIMAIGKLVWPDGPTKPAIVVPWTDNGEMIADVATMPRTVGYLDGTVLDATYGEGGFWTDWKPETLITNDLYKPADHRFDYKAFPFRDGEFDSVVFDPPYKLQGTPASGEMDDRYGTAERRTRDETLDDIVAGAIECYRVSRRFLLVKCQAQVEGGRVRWQPEIVTRAIEEIGGRKIDEFHLHYVPRPQPAGWRATPADKRRKARTFKGETARDDASAWLDTVGGGRLRNLDRGQQTARRNYSTLSVFARR